MALAPSSEDWEGCVPTSAGMVLAYWDQNGYPNFPNDDNYNVLIAELANEMGTDDTYGFTYSWMVDDGINAVAESHGYISGDWAYNENPDLVEAKDELRNGRPYVLYMYGAGSAYDKDESYDNHGVEVHGWIDAGGDYLTIYDTWDTEEHNFNWGNWWWAQNTYIEPGYNAY